MHPLSDLAVKVETYLREQCEYANVSSVSIIFTGWKVTLGFNAFDEIGGDSQDLNQRYRIFTIGDVTSNQELEAAIWKLISQIPTRNERELRVIAAATASVVELSAKAKSEAAREYGKAFAAQLNEMRAALPGVSALTTPTTNDEIPF